VEAVGDMWSLWSVGGGQADIDGIPQMEYASRYEMEDGKCLVIREVCVRGCNHPMVN
jgi:hypothetical protein